MKKRIEEIMTERTLVIIKPDGIRRGLVGEILSRFERCGLKIVGLKMVNPTEDIINKYFSKDEEWIIKMGKKTLETYKEYNLDPMEEIGTTDPKEIGEKIKKWNHSYLMMGPLIVVLIEGVHSIDMARKIIGHTLPYKAEIGTIRGDFSVSSPIIANLLKTSCKNLVHASNDKQEAESEIKYWFNDGEIVSFERCDEHMNFL